MDDYNRGIRELQKSVDDLKQVQDDIKNKNFDQVQDDWKKACNDLGRAYIYMPDMKNDPKLSTHIKLTALQAYHAYTKAADDPTKEDHISALNHSIQKLIDEMKEQGFGTTPEWK